MNKERTIFIVEDENELGETLIWLLDSVQLKAVHYRDGQQFLEEYASEKVACLLLDIRMPGISGLDLFERHIAVDPWHPPTIIMTAYADVPTAVRAMKAGAFDFLEKPVNENILLDRINGALSQGTRREQEIKLRKIWTARMNTLSKREHEIFQMLITGLSTRDISNHCHRSERTIDTYRRRVMQKMEARNFPQLIYMGLVCGLTPPLE